MDDYHACHSSQDHDFTHHILRLVYLRRLVDNKSLDRDYFEDPTIKQCRIGEHTQGAQNDLRSTQKSLSLDGVPDAE